MFRSRHSHRTGLSANAARASQLRCDLASDDGAAADSCARCVRLGLECKVESGFRRTRKRRLVDHQDSSHGGTFGADRDAATRRSFELKNEVRQLRQQLETRRGLTPSAAIDWALPTGSAEVADTSSGLPVSSQYGGIQQINPPNNASVRASSLVNGSPAATTTGPSPDPKHSHAPGLTTKPGIDQPLPCRRVSLAIPRPRALGNTALSAEEIDELFMMCVSPPVPCHGIS